MTYSNDKTKRHQRYHKLVKHTFHEQFATGAGRDKNVVCVMCSKMRPKQRYWVKLVE